MSLSPYGHQQGSSASGSWVRNGPVLTIAGLKAIAADDRNEGDIKVVLADDSSWKFVSASTLTGDDQLVVAPTAGTGRWVLTAGIAKLSLPITYATADAAVLLTLQAGQKLRIIDLYWAVTTGFSGGSSSAVGVSSNKTGHTTKGDLLGGAAGDVAGTLIAGNISGTVGAVSLRSIFGATHTIRFDRITSVFTAGAGTVEVLIDLIANPG